MSDFGAPDGELWQWSATDLAAAIRDGKVSCQDAVSSVVARISDSNGRLNAIVDDLTEAALAQAGAYDRALKDDGPMGPLHGVPVTIKVNVDQEGRATTNGVEGYSDVIAPGDAPVVRNLKRAGAIIVGRTNTPEFSFRATTDNVLHGRTINPWDEERSPGGSSGGAAVAALQGYGPIAHGNDIGGSLRFPSFMCGTATVRPTLGRVPAYNPSATEERGALAQLMSVQGAIAREVRDVRLATRIMAERDVRDPWWVPVPFDGPAPATPIKVAVTKNAYGYAIDPAIEAAVEKAAGILEAAGYAIEAVDPPHVDEIAAAWGFQTMGEVKIFMDDAVRSEGSATIQQIFDWYFDFLGVCEPLQFMRGIAQRSFFLRAWNVFMEDYALVLTPFLMRPTYGWNEDAESAAKCQDIFNASIYSFTMNYLGLPAAVIPTGLHDGLPISVQIVGQRYREDLCLDAAEAIERQVGIMAHELWARI